MTKWKSRAGAWAFALTVSAAPGARAGGGAADLPPVYVPLPPEAQAPESPSRRDPTAPISVVEVGDRRGEARVASELLSFAPGVLVQDRGGLLQTRTLSLRGASSNGVLVLLDGVPLNGAGGMVDLSRIPVAIVDRFEVLRGGGSLYAAGGLGGVVNVVTRKPGEGGLVSGALSLGSFGTGLGHLSAGGALWGGQGLVVLHGSRTDGAFPFPFDETPSFDGDPTVLRARDNNDVRQAGLLARYRRPLGEGTTVDLSAELAVDARGLAGTSQNPTPDARAESRRLTAHLRATRALDAGEAAARLWLRNDTSTFSGGLFGEALPQTWRSFGLEATGQWLVAGRHGLTGAAEVAVDALDGVTSPSSLTQGGSEAGLSWVRAGAAVSDELLLWAGRASLVPSVRVDRTGPFTTFSPKLGARWEAPLDLTIRANLGQAHRAPSFLELYVVQGTQLPNAGLRPERALYADLTVERSAKWARVAVTGFVSLYEDLIAYEYYPPFLSRPYNFAAARVEGVEAEAQVRPSRHFEARAAYTLTSSHNLRDDPRYYRKELPFRPRHRLLTSASFGVERVRMRAEVDLQSRQYMNRTNTLALPPRALVNLGLTAKVWKAPEVSLALEVKNLLDVQTADLAGYPLPGRAAYLTLSFSLDALTERAESPERT